MFYLHYYMFFLQKSNYLAPLLKQEYIISCWLHHHLQYYRQMYKTVNNTNLLAYDNGNNGSNGIESKGYTFQKSSGKRLTETYTKYKDFRSTYSVQFSLRYIFH